VRRWIIHPHPYPNCHRSVLNFPFRSPLPVFLSSSPAMFALVRSTVAGLGDELKQQAALLSESLSGVRYVSRQLLASSLPFDDSKQEGGATVANPITHRQAHNGCSVRQLASFLHKHHTDRFMIWNLSEKSYNYELLDNQVIEFRFPGYPAPPLSQLFSLCSSLHAWLEADPSNVALVHCQTGKGRTVCALSCYLAWSGQIASVGESVKFVCKRLGLVPEEVLIPTQKRYLDYLSSMLAGKKPSTAPVLLERVIMHGIPRLGDRIEGSAENEEGCRPYLQIFKDGKLLYTSTGLDSTALRWYTADDASVLFPVGMVLEGDILVRVRHLSSKQIPISMLRFGFHTGFISPTGTSSRSSVGNGSGSNNNSSDGSVGVGGNVRLSKSQLDGAYNDERFDDRSFWIDLIVRPAPDSGVSADEEKKAAMSAREEAEKSGLNDEAIDAAERQAITALRERAAAARRKQDAYWEEVHAARRQTTPTAARAGLGLDEMPAGNPAASTNHSATDATGPIAVATSPPPNSAAVPVAQPVHSSSTSPPTSSSSSSSSSASSSFPSFSSSFFSSSTSSLVPPNKSLGNLFSSALSLFSTDAAAALDGRVPTAEDEELSRLRARDEEVIRRARQKAASEAAIQAAQHTAPQSPFRPHPSATPPPSTSPQPASSHGRTSSKAAMASTAASPSAAAVPSTSSAASASTSSDMDSSFEGLQAYVAGLGSIDAKRAEVDVDSDEEDEKLAKERANNRKQREDGNDDEQRKSRARREEEELFESLSAQLQPITVNPASSTSSNATASSAATTSAHPSSDDFDADAAALEAELDGELDDLLAGEGEEVTLDDADEAALLASLQQEMDEQ